MLRKMPGGNEGLQMLFDRVAVCTGHLDHLAYCQPSVLFRELEDLYRKCWQFRCQDLFTLYLGLEALLLF